MSQPALSILIPGLSHRPWARLHESLIHQARNVDTEVEILIDIDNGEKTSGQKRFDLTHQSTGKYIAFIDDDDTVTDDYLTSLLAAIRSDRDVITFNVHLTLQGPHTHRIEIWKLGLHECKRKQGLMSANHLCAWKRDIAIRVPWCPDLGYGDDQLWYGPLIHSNLLKTERHIEKQLYLYSFSYHDTANQKPARKQAAHNYCGDGLGCYYLKTTGEVIIQVPQPSLPPGLVFGRNWLNQLATYTNDELTHFHTVRIR